MVAVVDIKSRQLHTIFTRCVPIPVSVDGYWYAASNSFNQVRSNACCWLLVSSFIQFRPFCSDDYMFVQDLPQ